MHGQIIDEAEAPMPEAMSATYPASELAPVEGAPMTAQVAVLGAGLRLVAQPSLAEEREDDALGL